MDQYGDMFAYFNVQVTNFKALADTQNPRICLFFKEKDLAGDYDVAQMSMRTFKSNKFSSKDQFGNIYMCGHKWPDYAEKDNDYTVVE